MLFSVFYVGDSCQGWGHLVKARLKEMSAYRRLLGDLLKNLPASASSHSYVVMAEVKESLYLDVSK